MSGAYGGRIELDAPASHVRVRMTADPRPLRVATTHPLNHAVWPSRQPSGSLGSHPPPASQVEVFVPGATAWVPPQGGLPADNVVYRVHLPAAVLLCTEFRSLLETGQLVATSVCARVDQGCAMAVVSTPAAPGVMVLSVDKHTYERLGIVGKRSRHHDDTFRFGHHHHHHHQQQQQQHQI
jgi:hypothetical protein